MIRWLFGLLLVLQSFSALADNPVSGRVVAVSDGDTFTILTNDKTQIKIRLFGVDCPEKKQDFGSKAKEFTSLQCFGKSVKVLVKNNDRYGRKIAMVTLPNGKDLAKELLVNGMAWHYSYYDKSKDLEDLELKARKEKKGLWSMKDPIAPWDFRKNKKISLAQSRASAPAKHCNAITKDGKHCQRLAKYGTRCWQHKL